MEFKDPPATSKNKSIVVGFERKSKMKADENG